MKSSLHDVDRRIEKEPKLELEDVDKWMLSDSDNEDHESTFFCSDFKETLFDDVQSMIVGQKLQSGRAETVKKEIAKDVSEVTLNPHKNENHFGDLLELNEQKGAMNLKP